MNLAKFSFALLIALALPCALDSQDVYDINHNGSRKIKYKKMKNLMQLSNLNGPVEVIMEGDSKATVLYGRVNPACDPDLVTYKKCVAEGTSSKWFKCTDEPVGFILVQSENKVLEIKTKHSPMKRGTYTSILHDLENKLKHRKAILSKTTAGDVLKLPNYKYTGYFRVFGSNAIPLSNAPGNRLDVIAAVSKVGMGHIFWFARGQYAFDLVKKESPMTPLKPILRSLCNSATKKFKELKRESFSKSFELKPTNDRLFVWSAFHDQLGEKRVESLRKSVHNGNCLFIAFDTWAYNVYISPYHASELKPFFIDGGIWPGNYNGDYFYSNNPFDFGGKDALVAQSSNPEMYLSLALTNKLPKDCPDFVDGLRIAKSVTAQKSVTEVYYRVMQEYRYHMEWLTPCSAALVTDEKKRQQLVCLSSLISNPFFCSKAQIQVPGGPVAFPGRVPVGASRKAFKLRFTSARTSYEAIPTSLYLEAGETVEILVLSGDPEGWSVASQWQSSDVSTKKKSYARWPHVRRERSLDKERTSLFSSFGGLLWFVSPKITTTVLEVQISNVIQAPSFDRRTKWMQGEISWISQRTEAKAPWGHLGGGFIVFVAPSGALLELENPQLTTDKYDRCVRAQRWLKGVDDQKRHREIIGVDNQIHVGYMHAGYPIMGYLNLVEKGANFLNVSMNSKDWGPFHELGHNLQHVSWTMAGYVEVTNNMFTIVCDELVNKRVPWALKNSWLKDHQEKVMKFAQGDQSFDGFFTRLAVYMHFQSAFGWLGLRRTFRSYITNPSKLTSRQAKFDAWYVRSSKVTGMDLAPLYLFWFWPISNKAQTSMGHLPAFLPDDFATRWAPNRVKKLEKQFGGRLTRTAHVLSPPTDETEDINHQSKPIPVEHLLEITSL